MSEEFKKWEYRTYSLGSILKSPKDDELMELLDEWGRQVGNWSRLYGVKAPTA